MALVPFTLETNLTLDNTNVTGNGIFSIYDSGEQNNSGSYEGIKVILEFSAMTPDPNDPVLNSNYSVQAVLEGKESTGATWYPLIRQFDVLRNPNQGLRQVLSIAPNIFTFDEGIPIDDWDGTKVTTRYNKKQDLLAEKWRVCINLTENKYGTSDEFTAVTVSIFGDRFNA